MFRIAADLSGLAGLADDFAARAKRAGLQGLLAIESTAAEEAPHVTGNLANTITTDRVSQVHAAAPYAPFLHGGTGLYGPKRERIRPKHKKALFWPGARHPVASVKGVKPNPFMDRGAAKAAPRVAEIFRR